MEKLEITDSGIPRHLVCRAVDDQHIATARKLDLGEKVHDKKQDYMQNGTLGSQKTAMTTTDFLEYETR